MTVAMTGRRTNHPTPMLDTSALALRRSVVELAPAQLTSEPLLSCDPIVDPLWQELAACRGMTPEIFFPESGATLAPARRVCAGCPVAQECRSVAIADPSLQGIWGGTSARERDRLRRAVRDGSRQARALTPSATSARDKEDATLLLRCPDVAM